MSFLKKIGVLETPKHKDSKVDGIFYKNGVIVGVFESKCRALSDRELKRFGSWLVTYQKIKDLKSLSELLRVPAYGVVYLLKDKKIRIWKIASDGEYCFKFKIDKTETQKTINGGKIKRVNAYLPVENSKLLK